MSPNVEKIVQQIAEAIRAGNTEHLTMTTNEHPKPSRTHPEIDPSLWHNYATTH